MFYVGHSVAFYLDKGRMMEMLKMYGSPICKNCVEAVEVLHQKGVSYEYHIITGCTAELKAFLQLRDHEPVFDAVKSEGKSGIPCFVKEDGTVTLNLEEALAG